MSVLEKAAEMLEQRPLCDHCLGRQFALLGHGLENDERGRALKLAILFEAQQQSDSGNKDGVKTMKLLASNGFYAPARQVLQKMHKRLSKKGQDQPCFVCQGKFENIETLVETAFRRMQGYDFTTFLIGIELPTRVEEREDEFRAAFAVNYGEGLRNEFGRLIGKRIRC